MKTYRCTMTDFKYKVGQLITENQYNFLPSYVRPNFKIIDNEKD
jgi:hypothetical protein